MTDEQKEFKQFLERRYEIEDSVKHFLVSNKASICEDIRSDVYYFDTEYRYRVYYLRIGTSLIEVKVKMIGIKDDQ